MTRHALVLTAGLGTRLRPLTDVRAKPAIPVAGVPVIRRIVSSLASAGVDDLVLNLHHLPETVTAVLGDGRDLNVRVRYSWEQPDVLGSAGGPRLALPIVGARVFWMVNGDTMTDADLGAMERAHHASGARVTLALVPNREFDRYGGVQVDASGAVTGFVRRGPAAAASYHFIGVQLVDATVFDTVRPGTAASSIGGVYDAVIAAQPGAVRGFISDAAFFDVGTVADYWKTCEAFPWKDGDVPRTSTIAESARVTRSILWDDVRVGADAVVDECILTDRVTIPAGADYRRTVVIAAPDGTLRTAALTW